MALAQALYRRYRRPVHEFAKFAVVGIAGVFITNASYDLLCVRHGLGPVQSATIATLVAAVALNRFAAMDVFNRLLMSVATVDYALPIAEMLRVRARAYTEVAHGAPPDRLHPVIREVQQELVTSADTLD